MEVLVVKDPVQGTRDTVYKSISLKIVYNDGEVFEYEVKRVPDDIRTWRATLQYLDETHRQDVNKLVNAISELLVANVPDDCHETYFNLLHALFTWLPEARDIRDPLLKWGILYSELEQVLFRFMASDPNRESYEVVFSCHFEEKLRITIPQQKFKMSPVPVSQAIIAQAYQERKEDVLYFIDNYDNFQRNIARLKQSTEEEKRYIRTFMNLSKALIILIKQGLADLAIYEWLIPEICTFILKYETDIEEQKRYLEYILESREDEEVKQHQLDEIIEACRSQTNTDKIQLMQVIGIISDHYLRMYDFEKSDHFWRKAGKKNRVLTTFLFFHKHSLSYLLILFVLLISLFLFVGPHSFFHWPIPSFLNQGWLLMGLSWLPPLLILTGLGFVVLSAALKSRHWLYSQLLLPRLVGAAIVGMFPLLFSSQSWLVGLQSNFIPWLLLLLLTYVSSFAYMFIEVYKTMKFVKEHSLQEAFKTSIKVFCIAACETLVIVTVTSMFVFPSISQSLFNPQIAANLNTHVPNLSVSLSPWLSFNLFPSLILLWGGFALFIGSFVQLLWQDRRITDPI